MRPTVRGFVQSLFTLLILLLGCAPCIAGHRHAASAEPDIRSNAALVLDETSSTVLLSRQAQAAAPIASITKLMTALVVLDGQQSLDELLKITAADCEHGRGAHSRLAVGTRLSRGDQIGRASCRERV